MCQALFSGNKCLKDRFPCFTYIAGETEVKQKTTCITLEQSWWKGWPHPAWRIRNGLLTKCHRSWELRDEGLTLWRRRGNISGEWTAQVKALSQKRVWQVEGMSGAGKENSGRGSQQSLRVERAGMWDPCWVPFAYGVVRLGRGQKRIKDAKGHKLQSYCNSPSSGGLVQEGNSEVGKK